MCNQIMSPGSGGVGSEVGSGSAPISPGTRTLNMLLSRCQPWQVVVSRAEGAKKMVEPRLDCHIRGQGSA